MKKRILKYKQMSKEELAKFLCELVDDAVYNSDVSKDSCCYCPAQNTCKLNHCGFLNWLDDENV